MKAATPKMINYRQAHTISIHAAREGGDDTELHIHAFPDISIHAAREGGDDCKGFRKIYKEYFNPRRP